MEVEALGLDGESLAKAECVRWVCHPEFEALEDCGNGDNSLLPSK